MAAPDQSGILITGGAGYVGSHSAKGLRLAGYCDTNVKGALSTLEAIATNTHPVRTFLEAAAR